MHPAILILGPTASGKTPLGQYLANHGLWGRCCFHFDFGEQLRGVINGRTDRRGLGSKDIQTIVQVVQANALLENSQFHIAAALLCNFLNTNRIGARDIVVLNGLPRHLDQVRDTEKVLRMVAVVVLDCAPEVVRERIRRNSGGDRTERNDDSDHEVKLKLRLYRDRTEPLIAYYERQRIPIYPVTVAVDSKPETQFEAIPDHPEFP